MNVRVKTSTQKEEITIKILCERLRSQCRVLPGEVGRILRPVRPHDLVGERDVDVDLVVEGEHADHQRQQADDHDLKRDGEVVGQQLLLVQGILTQATVALSYNSVRTALDFKPFMCLGR